VESYRFLFFSVNTIWKLESFSLTCLVMFYKQFAFTLILFLFKSPPSLQIQRLLTSLRVLVFSSPERLSLQLDYILFDGQGLYIKNMMYNVYIAYCTDASKKNWLFSIDPTHGALKFILQMRS
jgi:hypothetical protein